MEVSFTAPNCDADSLTSSRKKSRSYQFAWRFSWYSRARESMPLVAYALNPIVGRSDLIRGPQSGT
jgi:hypothetical protein